MSIKKILREETEYQKYTKKEIIEKWNHFCDVINSDSENRRKINRIDNQYFYTNRRSSQKVRIILYWFKEAYKHVSDTPSYKKNAIVQLIEDTKRCPNTVNLFKYYRNNE